MSVTENFLSRSRYRLTKEYPIKRRHCVDSLPPSVVWARPNQGSNSVGNLLLHLTGNVSEWILGAIGGRSINRDRASEFILRKSGDGATLLDNLEAVLREADSVLAGLTEKDLERSVVIQGRDTTVLAAIYHVVEHFSMHTGQIILLAKSKKPDRIRFYDMVDGHPRLISDINGRTPIPPR